MYFTYNSNYNVLIYAHAFSKISIDAFILLFLGYCDILPIILRVL